MTLDRALRASSIALVVSLVTSVISRCAGFASRRSNALWCCWRSSSSASPSSRSNVIRPDKEFYDEIVSTVASGVVGRGVYDAAGAWGGTNPFPGTLFVLTHRVADQPPPEAGFRFVGDLHTALAQAAKAAGDGDVAVAGGADIIRQVLATGRLDELVISTAPVILGAGKRLFDGFDRDLDLEIARVYSSPYATHVRYTVTK